MVCGGDSDWVSASTTSLMRYPWQPNSGCNSQAAQYRRGVSSPTAALLWTACRKTPSADAVADAVAAGADLALATDIALVERVSPLLRQAPARARVATPRPAAAPQLDN